MKIQCNSCEAAEAKVLCCADEAALCWACDEKVHAANKLASKHQRVPLISGGSSSRVPKCDICQESSGYFFCLEDRALFCRKCDVAIHTANSYVSAHQRFLLTGVQVGLEPTKPVGYQSSAGLSMPLSGETNEMFPNQVGKAGGLLASNVSFSGPTMTGSIPDWPLDDFFGLTDFNQSYGFTEHGSSKADSGKFGSSGSPFSGCDEELDVDDCLSRVPEIPWKVPEIPSPPTASGLHWQRNLHYPPAENSVSVPDICYSHYQAKLVTKRRRPF